MPNVQISNYDFLTKKENNNFSSNLSIKNYIHLHLDEKWIKKHYISAISTQKYWWILIIILSVEWYLRKKIGIL